MIFNKVSFTTFIKNEIIEYNWTPNQVKIIFFSFLKTIGIFKDGYYLFSTTLIDKKIIINNLFKKFYSLNVSPIETKTLLKYKIYDKDFIDKFCLESNEKFLKSIEENKAFISGVFLGKGWINSPKSRFYHCEFRTKNISHSLDIQEVLDSLGIKFSTIIKNEWYYTYIKKALDISTVISSFNASQSLMLFEDSRIERDFVATYKKMESIEQYNQDKTKKSSIKQIEAINHIFDNKKENKLSIDQQKISKIRIDNPNYSLLELQMQFNHENNKEVSKSTIDFWLKKIIEKSKGENK